MAERGAGARSRRGAANDGCRPSGLHLQHVALNVDDLEACERFYCDTLGVNPGERFDAIVECDRPGVWAFHCHILPHVEGLDGMFGMVTALVVLPPEE